MRFFSRWACLLLLAAAVGAQTADVAGSWEGVLELPSAKLRIRLHVEKTAAGALAAKMDSVDQGAMGIPVDQVSFADGVVRWSISRLGASYEGKLNEAGDLIEGTMTQGVALKLNLKRMSAAAVASAAIRRPQTPKPPYPYKVEEVSFASKAEGVTMGGTLTIPEGAGPHPAVILISGSGAQDRDETIFSHKPFLVLADHLTRKGIAVLRYDDRGVGKSTGSREEATSVDFSEDAEGGLDFLMKRKEIDAKRIGFVGHSEGGVIAPMIAVRRPETAFIVLMAGTGVDGEQILYEQGQAVLKANGASAEAIAAQRSIQEKIFAIVKAERDPAAAAVKLKEVLGGSPAVEQSIRNVNSMWFRYFLTYNPQPVLERVKCPVLALNGSLDAQVVPGQNLPAIEAALKKGGNQDFETALLPGLNHLMQTAKTGGVPEYNQIEETMAPAALDKMATWLRRRAGLETGR
ncbi:MAG: alpha/beta fold hydrolase [Bryobacteraceae bacterium]|nr:alpha/beta fold hydrolase [Bryobacteraceae bacterium]